MVLLSRREVQQILGALWLIDGLLHVQPQMFTQNLVYGILMPLLQNQPAPVAASFQWIIGAMTQHLLLVNLLIAVVQIAIGLSLLLGRGIRAALIVSIGWAVLTWYAVEGMGLLLTGDASVLTGAPGAFLLYVPLALVVYPRRAPERSLLSRQQLRWWLAGFWCLAAFLQLQPSWWVPGQISGSIGVMLDGGGLNSFLVDPVLGPLSVLTAQIEILLNSVLIVLFLGLAFALAVAKDAGLRPLLVVSMVISLAIWWGFEALGNILTGLTTDVNSGLVLIVIALACWPRRAFPHVKHLVASNGHVPSTPDITDALRLDRER